MRFNFSLLVICSFVAMIFFSCNKKENYQTYEQKFYLTNEDSVRVIELLTQYMDAVKDGDYEAALNILRWVDKEDPTDMIPLELTDKRRQEAMTAYKIFPVYKYKIEDVVYDYYDNNQAAVRVWFDKEDPKMTTVWYFKPIRYGADQWYLCLRSYTDGDKQLAPPKARDTEMPADTVPAPDPADLDYDL